MKILKDFKHSSNNIKFLLKKNYTWQKVGEVVNDLKVGDQLEFLVEEIHTGNDLGFNEDIFTMSVVQQFWVK